MQDLIYSLNIVLPVFLMGAIGYFLKQRQVITETFVAEATNVCFELLLPAMLFKEIYSSNFSQHFELPVFLYGFFGTVAVIAIAWLIVPRVVKRRDRVGVIIQSIFRSNFMLVGFPIIRNIYGDGGTTHVTALMAPVIAVFNTAAVLALTLYSDKEETKGLTIKALCKRVLSNHYIIAMTLAGIFVFAKISLPFAIVKVVDYMHGMSTPLALLALGGQFSFQNAKQNMRCSLPVCFIRLVFVPLVMVIGAVLLGFTGPALATVLVLFGSSAAISCSTMARNIGGDYELAGEVSLISTALSVISLFFFIFTLKRLGLL